MLPKDRGPTVTGLIPREYRHLVAAAVAQGWTLIHTSRHVILLPPDKAGPTFRLCPRCHLEDLHAHNRTLAIRNDGAVCWLERDILGVTCEVLLPAGSVTV